MPIEDSRTRLDIQLLLKYPGFSRSYLSKCIKAGYVKVNGEVVTKSSLHIKDSEIIEFDTEAAKKILKEENFDSVTPVNLPMDIVYEDEDLLAINKPSGMPTHPSHGHQEDTLLNRIHAYLQASDATATKFMIHRLDKDTSGLILFAKSDKMLWWMHRAFAERQVEKHYYALSFASKKYKEGEEFTIEGYLERSRKEGKHYVFSNKYGRWSKTEFKILKQYSVSKNYFFGLALIDCAPKTGRTHQIRVHLKQANLPIWSDPIYSSEKQIKVVDSFSKDNRVESRLFLHAYHLVFRSYNGKKYDIQIPLAEDLEKLLKKIDDQK